MYQIVYALIAMLHTALALFDLIELFHVCAIISAVSVVDCIHVVVVTHQVFYACHIALQKMNGNTWLYWHLLHLQHAEFNFLLCAFQCYFKWLHCLYLCSSPTHSTSYCSDSLYLDSVYSKRFLLTSTVSSINVVLTVEIGCRQCEYISIMWCNNMLERLHSLLE